MYTLAGHMRILVLSDVHSNLAALEAVLADGASRWGAVDALWNLGDTVGYGPQPSECIARLRELGAVSVAGNHDWAAAGILDAQDFNSDAARAVLWTRGRLTDDERAYLAGLPEVISEGDFTLVHGTLRAPVWEYMYSREAALAHLARQATPFALVGHTHVPMLAVQDPSQEGGCGLYRLGDGAAVSLEPKGPRLVINPGSVGQPRDGDPRAAYGLLDTSDGRITLRRVEYDVAATQRLVREAGLPHWLALRLAEGL